jgi:hypothetical protein
MAQKHRQHVTSKGLMTVGKPTILKMARGAESHAVRVHSHVRHLHEQCGDAHARAAVQQQKLAGFVKKTGMHLMLKCQTNLI